MSELDTEPLEVAWTGGHTYVVASPSVGEDGESNNVYNVNLGSNPPTCTCEHAGFNESNTAMCRHIFRAVMEHDNSPDMDRAVMTDLLAILNTMRQNAVAGATGGGSVSSDPTGGSSENAPTDSSSPDGFEDDHSVREMDNPEPEHDELADAVKTKFVGFAGTLDFDPNIIETNVVEYITDGEVREGISVEASPFGAGYWKDGSWQDKDGFEEEKEKFKNLCQNRDAVQWFGDPDYANVISISDAQDLVGDA